ncbi:MAG: dihydrofolate reductase family protein [Erysipelotrichales bacterium]
MNGKIIMNLAMSLDGYISKKDGSFDWIKGHNSNLDTKNEYDFDSFVDQMDVVVMGRNCYDDGFASDYTNKDVYVATNRLLDDYDNVHFIKGDIVSTIYELKNSGKNVFLFGGGGLVDHFIKADAIDEYIIGVIPVILGEGRRLFLNDNPNIELKLDGYALKDGIVIMHYQKR